MTDGEILKLISKEFELKTIGMTESYLEIHEPIYEDGLLRIDRIDREKKHVTIAYLPVQDEYFFFAVYLDPVSARIITIGTESRNLVSLIVSSETKTSHELMKLTKIKSSESWDKGDDKPNKRGKHSFTAIEFYLPPEPDEVEDKISKLLNYLEEDKTGIRALSFENLAYINVCMDFHSGNQFLGGFALDKEVLKRISALNLNLDFNVTAWGKGFL